MNSESNIPTVGLLLPGTVLASVSVCNPALCRKLVKLRMVLLHVQAGVPRGSGFASGKMTAVWELADTIMRSSVKSSESRERMARIEGCFMSHDALQGLGV